MLLFCCRYMNRGGVDNIGLLQQPIFAPLLLRAPLATSPPRLLPASCSARLRDVRSIDQIEPSQVCLSCLGMDDRHVLTIIK